MKDATRWSDLRTRVISAVVMVVLAGLDIASGGWIFVAAVAVLCAVMLWELSRMTRRDPVIGLVYAAAIVVAGAELIRLRSDGISQILWLILVVVASDICGYFVGRLLGGPKFWPRVSPKKTWSGTIAGWIGAALVGLGFYLTDHASMLMVAMSPILAFAGQLGDIAESAIKRRAGVKDASNLIPGHGGVLDRFDALIGAVVVVMLLGLILPLPLPLAH